MENSPLIERPRWVLVCWIFQAIWMLMTAFFYCLMWLVLLLVSKNPPAPNPDHRVFPISVWEAIFFVVYTLTWLVFPLVIIVIIVLQIRLRTMYTSSKHLYKREVAKMILATCVYISTMLLFIRQTANVPFIVIATAAWLGFFLPTIRYSARLSRAEAQSETEESSRTASRRTSSDSSASSDERSPRDESQTERSPLLPSNHARSDTILHD